MSFEEVIKSYYGKSVRIVDVDGEEFVGLFSQYEYSAVLTRDGVVLRDAVQVAHVRRVHSMQHQVHGGYAKHGLVDFEARELRGGAVLTSIGVPVVAGHLAFISVADVLCGRDEEARGSAGRVYVPTDFDTKEKALSVAKAAEKGLK